MSKKGASKIETWPILGAKAPKILKNVQRFIQELKIFHDHVAPRAPQNFFERIVSRNGIKSGFRVFSKSYLRRILIAEK